MTTDILTEQKILTKIRQLSPDAIQKLEEFIDQLLHSDNLSLSDEQTEKKIILVRISINV